MSADPTAEHVDAVARAILSTTPHHEGDDSVWETCGTDARAVLTSTDPAVHAAMLDALVRAGVLTAVGHARGERLRELNRRIFEHEAQTPMRGHDEDGACCLRARLSGA